MITAAALASSLPSDFVTLVQPGDERPVLELELVEPGDLLIPAQGALVIAVGTRDLVEAVTIVENARHASGLAMRDLWASDASIRALCTKARLPLLSVSADAAWSTLIDLLRSQLADSGGTYREHRSPDRVHQDLFDLADRFSAILAAPVTIEDATSQVLAYSSGQDGVDDARMLTIVGRQTPRKVRDHFRARGVFRRLSTSDSPMFIPAGDGDVKARYIVPVRAGGELLGSIWAVKDSPASEFQTGELQSAADEIALCLLRVRAQGEVNRQVRLDQIRSVLLGRTLNRPGWLAEGPWRVAILAGPLNVAAADARCQLWHSLARRRGWQHPMVVDVDSTVYAIVREDGTGAGTWAWLTDVVVSSGQKYPSLAIVAGGPVGSVSQLQHSRAMAEELVGLEAAGDEPVVTVESAWTTIVLARAVAGLRSSYLVSPLTTLLEEERLHGGDLVDTLTAVLDHWGEPRRAARVLGVHPNTVRNRLARLAGQCPVDLADPTVRLALRLEIARAVG